MTKRKTPRCGRCLDLTRIWVEVLQPDGKRRGRAVPCPDCNPKEQQP